MIRLTISLHAHVALFHSESASIRIRFKGRVQERSIAHGDAGGPFGRRPDRRVEGLIFHRLRLKAVQPVEEIHEHPESLLLGGLHRPTKVCAFFFHTCVIHERMILPLERDGVVEKKLWCVFKHLWDSTMGEIQVYQARGIGEDESDVVGWGLGENGKCMAGTGSHLWDGAVGEDKNGTDGLDVRLDLALNIFVMELVLFKTARMSQPRGVEDAKLGKW